ncbi:MAG TPA: hypothetical protein VJ376_14570 [Pseudomonadota bacterium]|nr:hypothetical protein [Pseudomonadota bacterium]
MPGEEDRGLSDSEAQRLAPVPSGAVWLAGIAVGSMLVAWFLIYLLIYLPRGSIG